MRSAAQMEGQARQGGAMDEQQGWMSNNNVLDEQQGWMSNKDG
jgi:hypothetical protein